ncbi:MAG TPA: sarcosine oxidase subunit delta [Burkholderiales bacterium]|nr:sarcosine oxidase subunit delta [Burkholderiales bacterium]
MMLIECPFCGPRNYTEFTYGGDAGITRPREPDAVTDAEWTDYLYVRNNPRGMHDELWYHSAGCRRWITVHRDTLTHDVAGTEAVSRASMQLP